MNRNPRFEHLLAFKWKPGQSGNVNGRPKSIVTVLQEMGYVRPVISAMVCEIMFMNFIEVERLSESKTEPVIRKMIARAFYSAGYSGEYKEVADFLKLIPQSYQHIPESFQDSKESAGEES